MYSVYKNFEYIATTKNLTHAARMIGTSRQNLCASKEHGNGCYHYKDYLAINPLDANDRIAFKIAKLVYLLKGSPRPVTTHSIIDDALDKLLSTILG